MLKRDGTIVIRPSNTASIAGFAKGLGREVIFTVKEDDVEKLHFDTRQYNHIVYDSPEDLYKKLYNRICATIV